MASIPYINIHSHHPQNADELSILNAHPGEQAIPLDQLHSIGIHPWYINELDISKVLNFLTSSISNKNMAAIGECGLDRIIDVPIKIQEQIFIEQIKIAEKFNKPMIIHCVKAFDGLMRIKKENSISAPLIIHGFNNSVQIAKQLLAHDFYLSFGKALLMEGSNAQKTFEDAPLNKVFLETDDSDAGIKTIFKKAAIIKKISEEELKEKIFLNFKKVFTHE